MAHSALAILGEMNGRVLLSAVGFLLAGAALGYAAIAAGPLPLITAIVFLILLLVRFRSQPEQPGAYMVGVGLTGAAVLINVIGGCSPPSCHYDVRTPLAAAVFILVAVVGAGLLVRAIQWRRFS
jgi:chromate transport protein ChrA